VCVPGVCEHHICKFLCIGYAGRCREAEHKHGTSIMIPPSVTRTFLQKHFAHTETAAAGEEVINILLFRLSILFPWQGRAIFFLRDSDLQSDELLELLVLLVREVGVQLESVCLLHQGNIALCTVVCDEHGQTSTGAHDSYQCHPCALASSAMGSRCHGGQTAIERH
jgi:hypothetical protein